MPGFDQECIPYERLPKVCIATAWYSLKRKRHGSLHKYALFGAWSVAICMIASCIDSSVSLLYALPIILAIRYYSVGFTLSISVLNIIFAFIPYIIKVYIHAFPLDFVVLEEGAVITMAGDSLHETVNALSTIDVTATITIYFTDFSTVVDGANDNLSGTFWR